MTIGGIIECSTCTHKIRVRHQIGIIHPVQIRIACNGCGKIIKGTVDLKDPNFDFPFDKFSKNFEITPQVVSISTELPIVIKSTNNENELLLLTPFLAITDIIHYDKITLFGKNLSLFKILYDEKFKYLLTCFELFENKNWKYFLSESNKHFNIQTKALQENFDDSCKVLVYLNSIFFQFLSTKTYETDFKNKLQEESIDAVVTKIAELKSLRADIETYINLEIETIKGIKLIDKFLSNVNSFFPVIVLSYNDDFIKQYNDEIGITTFEFLDLKEMYIEQFEFLSRISSLYFGLINLAERNDFNDFGTIRDCNVLTDYFNKDNGVKKDILKKHPILNAYFLETLNSQLRNGIGHLKTVYEPRTQLIKYYPYKDAARMNVHKEIYLIDFTFQVYQQALKIRDSLELLAKFIDLTK